MKKYCTQCFDVQEIVQYIEENGELGNCHVCGSIYHPRLDGEQISHILQCYLNEAYIDRKAEVLGRIKECQSLEARSSLIRKEQEEGWQSVSEILIEDKEIFSQRIPKEKQKECLRDLIYGSWTEAYEAYEDMEEKRFIPK